MPEEPERGYRGPIRWRQQIQVVRETGEIWCGQEDSNFQEVSPTSTSSWRVYQFRHDRIILEFKRVADGDRLDQAYRAVYSVVQYPK
jgi:hypothetical protein